MMSFQSMAMLLSFISEKTGYTAPEDSMVWVPTS
jgi:hypothetical protein